MAEVSIKVLKERQDTVRNNWGFIFALACATLWGTCYQGIGFISQDSFIGSFSLLSNNPYASGFCLSFCLTLCVTAGSLLWLAFNSQLKEWLRLVTAFHYNNLLCMGCALCGGIAAWSTYVIAFSFDATFSVIIVMFYPVIGMMISRRWLGERVSKHLYAGLILIVLGWIILYLPEIIATQSTDQLPIYMIGALAGVCWGIEGALANKVMETVDSTVMVATRYSYESVVMVLLAVGLVLFAPETLVPVTSIALENPVVLFGIILVVGICLTVNYFCWYKSFLLCGVSRGLVVSDISGFVTVIVGMLLLTSLPSWPAVLACVLMSCGVFIVYNDSAQDAAMIRTTNLMPLPIRASIEAAGFKKMPDKMRALCLIAQQGALWDYEITAELTQNTEKGGGKNKRIAKRARVHLIEAAAVGIIVPVEYAIDTGTYFGEGKLLTCYALTEYGNKRLSLEKNI